MPIFDRLPWPLASRILLGLAAMLMFTTASHYGDSWDEKIRADAGDEKLAYYHAIVTGNWDEARTIGLAGDNYPGFHDLTLALLRKFSPLSDHLTGNVFCVLLGLLTLAGAMALGRRLGGPAAGFLAGLLLLTLPRFYGHSFINPKDIPFAFGYVWSLCFLWDWFRRAGPPAWTSTALTGLFIGITMASRIGGLVLVCYLGLFLLGHLILRWRSNREGSGRLLVTYLRIYGPRVAVVLLFSFAVLLIFWPSGQWQPFSRTSETLGTVTKFSWPMPVFFNGAFYAVEDLPFTYLPKLLLLTTPVHLLLLAFIGSIFLIGTTRKSTFRGHQSDFRLLAAFLILFATVFPLAYVIFRDSVVYNGIRHLLFILPPAAAMGGWVLMRSLKWLEANRPQAFVPAVAVLCLSVGLTVIQMVRLHPYQYIYYNALAGGPRAASESYETDYWGTAFKELAVEFYDHLKSTRPTFNRPLVVVNMEQVTWLFEPFLPESDSLPIQVVRSQPDIDDYYAATTTWSADQFHPGNIVVTVERAGIPLAVVKDRRHLGPEELKQ